MFLLPEHTPADLFILYPPGARGDFLAAILKDSLDHQYKNYSITPPSKYQKSHYVRSIVGYPLQQYNTRIRIKLSEVEEYLTVAQLWQSKIKISATMSWTSIMRNLLNDELDQLLPYPDSNFTHVINFKNLYDIEFIKQIYYDINALELSLDAVKKIQYNIDLQPWVTMSNCKP